jgi:hypothetical protein
MTPVVIIGVTIRRTAAAICKVKAAAMGQRLRFRSCGEDSRSVSRNMIPSSCNN